MQKIWNYKDYVSRLPHPEVEIRDWAFRSLNERYPNRYTDEVVHLIGDEKSYLASMAPRYLARHGAVQHAEKILDCFRNSEGNVRSNCISALGRLKYEPATAEMIDLFLTSERGDSVFGLLDYFANIDQDDCRDTLRTALDQLTDPFELDVVATSLLRHFQPRDGELIIDACLTKLLETGGQDSFLKKIATILSGEGFFRDITEGQAILLDEPEKCINQIFTDNSFIIPPADLLPGLTKALFDGHFSEFAERIMFAAKTIVQERYSDNEVADWLRETHGKDQTSLAVLEALAKRSTIWKKIEDTGQTAEPFLALILALFCGLLDRENHLEALAPDASLDDLLDALAQAGSGFPEALQDRIVTARPVDKLIDILSDDLSIWGDIWAVQIMGKIASPAFIPHLLRVLNETDGLSYIHDYALSAINGIAHDEGDKLLLDAVRKNEVENGISVMSILRHLSYPETYELALEKWHDDTNDIDDYETFAICLEGIGDPRGVKTLQDIYNNETSHPGVGEPLECLAKLHDMDIPELAAIEAQRRENEKFRKNRAMELAQLARNYEKNKDRDAALPAQILPFKRETQKVGRNEPCPCGSGKKYKKCCLRK